MTADHIIEAVARHFWVSPSDITGRSRPDNVAMARHAAAALIREKLSLNLTRTGQLLGNRDHGTVLNSLRKLRDRCDTCPRTKASYLAVRAELGLPPGA